MAQGFVNGVFNETWTHSCLQFEWFSVGYGSFFMRVAPLFFSESVFLLVYFIFHWLLIFDTLYIYIYICVCVCVCV